jgi:guanosine-3',5'-bis(diphosphate) 3'-pyrophosphohydrolase
MRTLGVMKPEKRRRIAKETLEIYSPIANRLGMNDIRMEFEDLCFYNVYPMRARRIQAALDASFSKRDKLIEETRQVIEEHLKLEGLNAIVDGREKHLFSIYQKMRLSGKSFQDITDVFGFRVIVNSVDTCYRALGAMHALFKPISTQFKDYIAIPKSNGYQSLHSILIGMHGIPIEVQIRTEDMDEMANNGIAAHWLYKQDQEYSTTLSGSHKRARQWVQNLLEMQERTGNSLEFIENVKIDLFPDEVYVFTPKGKILELPQSATAIDFAYAVHTDLGNQCVGCYINRRLSPLSQVLGSGETVEIITSDNSHPSPVWLDFVVTGKARSHIRHALKNQRQGESIDLGRRLLNKAFSSLNSSIDKVPEEHIVAILEESQHANFDELLSDIGLGNRAASLTAQQLIPHENTQLDAQQKTNPLVISGTEGMVITFAKCCHPLPGDNIRGLMTAGRGVVVHTDACSQVKNKRKEAPIELRWDKNLSGEFSVPIRVELERQRGVVATLATKINSLDGNIESLSLTDIDAHTSQINATILVQNRVHLARIFKHIRNIKSVTAIYRIKDNQQKKRNLH